MLMLAAIPIHELNVNQGYLEAIGGRPVLVAKYERHHVPIAVSASQKRELQIARFRRINASVLHFSLSPHDTFIPDESTSAPSSAHFP